MDISPITDNESLLKVIQHGEQPKYLFFWGHQPSASGVVGKECFSQWYSAPFVAEGEQYSSAEHYMMAEKARLFGDEETRQRILHAANPGAAKRFGREVRGFDEKVWTEGRSGIVVRGNIQKFEAHPSMRDFLLGTKDRVLVEASPVDRIWGIGLAADDERATNPELWCGLNLLGYALMEVRRYLGG